MILTKSSKLIAISASLIAMSFSSFGQNLSQMDESLSPKLGKVECRPFASALVDATENDSKEFCTYTLVNLTRGQELIKKVTQALFNNNAINSDDGLLEVLGHNNRVIIFRHKDPAVLKMLKDIIPIMDSREDYSTSLMVEFTTDIYEISETGLSNLNAEISKLGISPDGAGGSVVSGDIVSDGKIGVNLKLGIFQLTALLSAEKSKGTLKRMNRISRTLPNLSRIEVSTNTPIDFSPGPTSTIERDTGVKLNGTISVNANTPSLVNIKGFDLKYGKLNADGTVTTVKVPYDNLMLQEGVAIPIVSTKTVGSFTSSSSRTLGLSRSRSREDSKLLIYSTVKVLTWEDYIASLQGIVNLGKAKFDKYELSRLTDSCPSNTELIKAMQLFAHRDSVGDPVLSIKLNKNKACLGNIKTKVKVTIRGEKIDKKLNTHYLSVENLMHIPLRIEGIAANKFSDPKLNFRVQIKTFGKNPAQVKYLLQFDSNSGHDIGEDFWIKK